MMCNASWKRRITLLVVLTVAFIWGNSLMPGTVSGAISDWAGAVLSRIFGGEVDTMHGHGVLRKLAHGTEYLILGVELCLLLRPEKPWSTLALSGVLTALLDELVWGLDGDGNSDTIMEHIRKIRAKFAAHTLHNYIETVWGCGYRWNA